MVQYIYKYIGKNGFPYFITHVNGVSYFVKNASKLIREGTAKPWKSNPNKFVVDRARAVTVEGSEDRVEIFQDPES